MVIERPAKNITIPVFDFLFSDQIKYRTRAISNETETMILDENDVYVPSNRLIITGTGIIDAPHHALCLDLFE